MKITVRGLDLALQGMEDALDRAAEVAVARAAEMVSAEARDEHAYRNRTGDLEASTRSLGRPTGSFLNDTLQAVVVADMPYGEHVDRRTPFLLPAWERHEYLVEQAVEWALEAALR